MTNLVTQTFIPGPRLIDGTDLNTMVSQVNAGFVTLGGTPAITALSTVGAGTITAAGIVGGVTARGGAQGGSAFTDTTDTAAAIISALGSSVPVNSSFYWTYENTTNAQATLSAGSGVTLTGNAIVPKLTVAMYVVTKTSSSAVTIVYFAGGQYAPLPYAKYGVDTVQNATATAGGLTGAQIVSVRLTGATPATVSVGPAADIVAATPNAAAGLNYLLTVVNPAATTAQLTGLTGVTIGSGGKILPTGAQQFNVSLDSLTSITMTGITATNLAS